MYILMDDPTSSFPASELKEKHDMSLITDDFWSKESSRDRVSHASDFAMFHMDAKVWNLFFKQVLDLSEPLDFFELLNPFTHISSCVIWCSTISDWVQKKDRAIFKSVACL